MNQADGLYPETGGCRTVIPKITSRRTPPTKKKPRTVLAHRSRPLPIVFLDQPNRLTIFTAFTAGRIRSGVPKELDPVLSSEFSLAQCNRLQHPYAEPDFCLSAAPVQSRRPGALGGMWS
jgi:hypothetical protein